MSNKKCSVVGCNNWAFKFYGMCEHHLNMKNEGSLEKNKDGKWVEIGQSQDNTNENEEEKINACIICGKPSGNFWFCKDCYKEEIKATQQSFDHNICFYQNYHTKY